MTFGEKVIAFYNQLHYSLPLPEGIALLNPFLASDAKKLTRRFYTTYFPDSGQRTVILGINPGRFGAGATGIPFTDTIRLNEKCNIDFDGFRTYEPSSAFIYEMIEKYGGVREFYRKFFISAVCPLGFTKRNHKGKMVNFNYYDSRELTGRMHEFIVSTLKQQLDFGIDRNVCFCLGSGKNDAFLRKLNEEHHFFNAIITLEHPRYIMQYKARSKEMYIGKYIDAFTSSGI